MGFGTNGIGTDLTLAPFALAPVPTISGTDLHYIDSNLGGAKPMGQILRYFYQEVTWGISLAKRPDLKKNPSSNDSSCPYMLFGYLHMWGVQLQTTGV
jgi:hypothetical protein